jgi:3-oxoacyl-[acyl-carrier-protein] synthase III
VHVPGGGSWAPLSADGIRGGKDRFHMRGRAVAEYAHKELPPVIHQALMLNGLAVEDIDRWVMHQANPKLLIELTSKLGIDPARVPLTAPAYGNLGAASAAVTLAETHALNPFKTGDRLMLAALGGGMQAIAVPCLWFEEEEKAA